MTTPFGRNTELAAPLQELLRQVIGAEDSPHAQESRNRAAHAPWPELGFRSALDLQELFREGAKPSDPRRAELEQLLRRDSRLFASDAPYFVCDGTTGTVRSPFPELTDGEFWVFVVLWGDEQVARRELATPYRVLGGMSGIEFIRRRTSKGWSGWLRGLFQTPTAPIEEVYTWHMRNRAGAYS